MIIPDDTIAAIATPPGRGGVGIVRVSGPGAGAIAEQVLARRPAPRRAVLAVFRDADGRAIDEGLALWMPGPDSFTGEDVLELHGHGGIVVMDLILARLLELGARPAQPGEFSQRAFLNERMDLAQTEAIADLIDSGSAEAARAAARSLRGELSERVNELVAKLTELRIYTEAAIDFPEEEIDFLADASVAARLERLRALFDELATTAKQGALLREGMTVVIAGVPNAGKSSLLNRLAGYDAAIVTDIAGTTRDVLRERIDLDGMPLHVIDTAGLRRGADAVEREGVRRARVELANADRILLIVDCRVPTLPDVGLPEGVPVTIVRNKIDLVSQFAASVAGAAVPELEISVASRRSEAAEPADIAQRSLRGPVVDISARTGAGIDALREHLKRSMGYRGADSGTVMARRRHLDALARARAHVEAGVEQLSTMRAGELLAEELRLAQTALGEITGEFTSDDLLGRIFSAFCIGK